MLDNQNKRYAENTRFHSTGGLLTVSDIRYKTPLSDAFLEAAHSLGYQIGDINAETSFRFTHQQATIKDGKRDSTSKAFLKPALGRQNLDVILEAHVIKILFDKYKRSRGVLFSRHNKKYVAKTNGEIILSAGTIGSPHILMHSGIGPSYHLKGNLNIKERRPWSNTKNKYILSNLNIKSLSFFQRNGNSCDS